MFYCGDEGMTCSITLYLTSELCLQTPSTMLATHVCA